MDKHALTVLEFKKIKEQLRGHITSNLTKVLVDNLEPKTSLEYIKVRQEEVTQAKKIIIREKSVPLGGIRDIRDALKRANKDIVLEGRELLDILNTLVAGHRLNNYFLNLDDEDDEYYRLTKIATKIFKFKELEKSIKKAIDKRGEVKDTASVKLNNIRKNIRGISDNIRTKLDSIVNSRRYEKYIQEAVVTLRDDRYVVPVKVEYKGNFPGIVHDQSASGQTLFIEPMPVVKMNNKLRQLSSEEEQEIYRILQELTLKVKEELDKIKATVNILSTIDFIFAKAKYSLEIDASEPLLNQNGYINLTKARHPLLKEDVVPINIYLGNKFNTLIITGPNTGGKTVTIKTVGLLTLMAQAGLHIPALSGSQIGIYEKIYGDIGDEQSIEQSLSTFSSHMTQIIKIIEEADENSLVLLDELGAGTDPAEGAALAMSLLDNLHNQGAKTVATTHYSQLKSYAYQNDGVENASVEFDVETLKPTYKLQMGLPGRSNAFQIAGRLGLNEDVIAKANEFLDQEDIELDQIIKEIEDDKKAYSSKREQAEKGKKEVENMKEEYQDKLQKLEDKKERELKEAHREANKIIKRAKQRAEGVIKELKEEQKLSDRGIERAKSKLRDEEKEIKKGARELAKERREAQEVPQLEIGDKVKIKSLSKKGEVLELYPDKKEALIRAGMMKVNIDLRELEKTEEKEEKTHRKTNVSQVKGTKTRNISSKLDLRGLRALDAKSKVDKYLDDVMLANLNQIEIVHGKGTGALRKVVHQVLDKYPGIKEYRLGKPKEGGTGVTVVNL